MNVFALKMAGVFMISTATLAMRTHILPRSGQNAPGLCPGGAASAEQPLCRLVAPGVSRVLVLSIYILVENLRRTKPGAAA